MGLFECVMFLSPRRCTKYHVLGRIKSSMSGGGEQVKGQDLVEELLKSLNGTRKAAHNWEKKWHSVLIEMNFEFGTWSPAIV